MAIWRSSTEEMIRDRKRRQLIGGEDRRDSKKQVMAIWAVICFLAALAVVAVKKHNDGSLTIWSIKKGSNLSLAEFSATPSKSMTPEEISDRVCRSIVRVVTHAPNGSAATGSGVVVDANTVATSGISVPTGGLTTVEKNGASFPATILAGEQSSGMVLLHVPNLKAPVVSMAMIAGQKQDEQIISVSAIDGARTAASVGKISAIQHVDGIATMHVADLGKYGMPGCGVFNDRGFLIGMLLSKNTKQNSGLALSSDAIIDAMARLLESQQGPATPKAPEKTSIFAPKAPQGPTGGKDVDEQLKAYLDAIAKCREELASTEVDMAVADNEIRFWKKETEERQHVAAGFSRIGDVHRYSEANAHTQEALQNHTRAWQWQNELRNKKAALNTQIWKYQIAHNQIASRYTRPAI